MRSRSLINPHPENEEEKEMRNDAEKGPKASRFKPKSPPALAHESVSTHKSKDSELLGFNEI